MSLVFTWPYWLLFWCAYLWAFAPEFRILRDARKQPGSQDAKSRQFIESVGSLGLLAAFVAAGFIRTAALPHAAWLFWIGIAAMICGSLLRRHCFRMLGKSFTGSVIVTPDQPVVDRGAYRFVRHPSYTGGAILFAGIGVALGNWLSIVLIVISTAVVYAYRVRVEEAALCEVIGEPYRGYMSRTKRFIPYVF
jgi:protein-S-isoprenylcysteine O-methyltransferase Ste14